MNGIDQIMMMNFSNKNSNIRTNNFKHENTSFRNLLENNLGQKQDLSKKSNSEDQSNKLKELSNSLSMHSRKNNNKHSIDTEQELGSIEGNEKTDEIKEMLIMLEEEIENILIMLEEEEIPHEVIENLINLLMSIDNEKFSLNEIEKELVKIEDVNLPQELKEDTKKLLEQLTKLLESNSVEGLTKEQKLLLSEKASKIIKDFSSEMKFEVNKETKATDKLEIPKDKVDRLNLSESTEEVTSKEPQKKHNVKNMESSSTENTFYEKNFEASEPKEINFILNNNIKGETLANIGDKGLPAQVSADNIITQIATQINKITLKDGNEIKIQLMPENLGNISLKITREDNTFTARILAESIPVKETIESNLNQLRDSLSEKGISISNIEVFVGQDSDAYRQRQFMQQKSKSRKITLEELDEINLNSEDLTMMTQNPYLNENSFDMKG